MLRYWSLFVAVVVVVAGSNAPAAAADGIWGPRSKAALQAFRLNARLGNHAHWDLETEKALFALDAPRQKQRFTRRRKTTPSPQSPFERPGGMFGN